MKRTSTPVRHKTMILKLNEIDIEKMRESQKEKKDKMSTFFKINQPISNPPEIQPTILKDPKIESQQEMSLLERIVHLEKNQKELQENLYKKIYLLEKEIEILKTRRRTTKPIIKRETIIQFPNFIPEFSFKEWYKSFSIRTSNLNKIFETNMIEGMKEILEINLSRQEIPITMIAKKIYIYENPVPSTDHKIESFFTNGETPNTFWREITMEDGKKMVAALSTRFLQLFMDWRMENREIIERNEILKKNEIVYMKKMFEFRDDEKIFRSIIVLLKIVLLKKK